MSNEVLNSRRVKAPKAKIYKEDQEKSEYESFYENISGSINEDLASATGRHGLEYEGGRNKSS
jgi:hypothetical protein